MDGNENNNGRIANFEELISSGNKRRFRLVHLPISGKTVRIRSLFEEEVSQYQAAINGARNGEQLMARLAAANRKFISLCLVDKEGNPIVSPRQVDQLKQLDGADTSFLYKACAEHVGITASDIEELVKNSETTQTPDSSTS